MFSEELMKLIPQVIASREVLLMVVVLVAFMWLVNYVARSYHRPRSVSKTKPKKAKKAKPAEAAENTDEVIQEE
jgi:Na+-transporting methylmalonyl-CoA/oxaloacetate decarboxylase gamma subunit